MRQAGFAKYAFLGISVLVIVGALGALFFLTKPPKKIALQQNQQTQIPTVAVTPTPVITPLTQENAQPTIDATEQNMQQALNQANADLQTEGQVNAAQDNTTGL